MWFILDLPKDLRKKVLNIPSGTGRLNPLLSKYFEKIMCVDVCPESTSILTDIVNGQVLKYVDEIKDFYI